MPADVPVPATLLSQRQYKGSGANWAFLLTFIVGFLVQLPHIHPALPGGDSGELMACCRWLLLAHPPGFPLYITVCHFASRWLVWLQYIASAFGLTAAPGELERLLLTSTASSPDTHILTDNYFWVWAMHATSALFHAFAAALLTSLILRTRISADPRPAVRPSTTKDTRGTRGKHRLNGLTETQTAIMAGIPVTANVPLVTTYGKVDELAFHILAIVVGLSWCTSTGVLEYGTQTEVFALNNALVALMLYLWAKEEGIYALNCVAALPSRVTIRGKVIEAKAIPEGPSQPLLAPPLPRPPIGIPVLSPTTTSPVSEDGPTTGVVRVLKMVESKEVVEIKERTLSSALSSTSNSVKARSPLGPSSSNASPRPSIPRPHGNSSIKYTASTSRTSGVVVQPPTRLPTVPYTPRFRPPLAIYWWWALLAAVAICHQQAILFLALPIMLRVLYLHIRCSARHKGLTLALLIGALLVSVGLCIFIYYMVLSRLIDRTHLGSWGFPDENLGKSYKPAATQYTFESPESLFSIFVPSHSPTYMDLAVEQADPSTVSSYPTQPLPTYFNVGRHLLRSDYGTFKLHSGRGGFTVGLSPWVYWGRLLFAVDWAIQNAPWWLWVINGAMVVWTVSERIYLWATLKISTLKRRFAAATGAGTLAPLQRPPLPHPPYVSRLAPAHGMKSPSADLLGGQSPSEPGAFDVSISPRSLAGQIFTASPSGRAKAIETPNSNPSPTPRSGSFEGYGSVFPFAEEATPTPSSTPTSANDISKAGDEGNASFPTLNDMMHRRYSVTDVAAALPPRLLYDATLLFNTNIRVWSMAFGMASVLFFNAMANIDISEVKEGGSENDQLHVAVHVYHRFWLQSLLPFALCFGATLSRAVAELLSASSIRRASTTTSSIVIGVGVAAAVSMMGMRAEDRSPMRYARSEVTDTPWDGSYIRTTKSKKQRKSQNLHNTTMSDPERSKAILNSGQATSPLDQYLNAYSANVSYTFAAYGRSALTSLPPHAIVVTSGDQHLTAIRFQQWVLGYRADVVHIDRELAHYGWYRAALKEHRGISIQSPRVEPLLQSLLKSSWHVDSTQEPKGASPDDSRQKKTVKRRIKRRLFALEDATLTTSTGDYWRTIGTPVYAGWFYEIVAKKHAAKLKERLCEGGLAIRQSRIPSTPLQDLFMGVFMNGSSSASDVPIPPNEAKASLITMYSHPSLEVATIDLFGRSLPKIHGVIKCYHPWEAAVIQHYNLALKNAFLAEAVRFETQCEADEDTTPSTSLSWLSKRAHDGLRKEHFSQSVWEANVMPFLKALAQFL